MKQGLLYDLAPTQFTSPVPCYPTQSPLPSFLLALHFLFPLSGTSTASPTLTPNITKGIFIQIAPSHLTADNPSLGRVPQSFLPQLVTFYHTTLLIAFILFITVCNYLFMCLCIAFLPHWDGWFIRAEPSSILFTSVHVDLCIIIGT